MGQHEAAGRRPWSTRRWAVTAALTIGFPLAMVTGIAIAGADSPGTDCTGTAPDENGVVNLRCHVPMPTASTVTVTVPGPTVTVPGPTTTTTVTVTKTVTATPTQTTSTPPPTTPTPTQPPSTPPPTTQPPTAVGFPTAATAGVPAGWQPTTTRSGWTISAAGTYENVRVNGGVNIMATGVILRNVEVVNGAINTGCKNPTLDHVTVRSTTAGGGNTGGAVYPGGYTARYVKIDNVTEGFRVSGKSNGCGAVTIENSYARTTGPCNGNHVDTLQGYDGNALTVRNTTLILDDSAGGCATAPFFYPSGQGNTSVDIDGLYLAGPGYSFRLGMPGVVKNVRILDGSWDYGPVDAKCSVITQWDVKVVNASGAVVRTVACGGTGN